MVAQNKFWSGKQVLITGHSGFKGSWHCLWLKKMGADISGLSLVEPVTNPDMFSILEIKKSMNDFRGDISSKEFCLEIIEQIKPEIIFHMAAQPLVRKSYTDPLATYNTNVIGTANILQAARSNNSIRAIVVITTDKCYENIEKDYAYIETDPLGGYDPYSSSKACAEHISSAYYRSFFREKGVGIATARAGNVIGGGDWSNDRLIPDAVKTWLRKKKLILRYPNATRPWQHVMEPLSGYILLAEHLWGKPDEFSSAWNFGPNPNSIKTVMDTIKLASTEWGGDAAWQSSNKDHLYETSSLQLNSKKAQSLLGWKPRDVFSKAVGQTIRWYKSYYNNNTDMKIFPLDQITEYERISTPV